MPSINIKNDTLTADILTSEAGPGSGIAKYFKGDLAGFIATKQLSEAFSKSITTVSSSPVGLGLSFSQGGSFGTSGIEWKLKASANVTVDAVQSGNPITGDSVFANPLTVPPANAYLGVAFTPTLSASISGALGDLQFGFEAGGAVEFRAGRFFDVNGQAPTLGKALNELLTTGVVPGDMDDLRHMVAGDTASVAGFGTFRFSAKFNVAQALNPLATPTLGLEAIGALKLEPKVKLEVGASVGVSGRYQIRAHKLDANRVQLGLYKMAGTQFGFNVTASTGLEVGLGKRDFSGKVMAFLGGTEADVERLVDAGVSDDQIDEIKKAIKASLDRSLAISLAGNFAVSSTHTTVFEYAFDLSKLDEAGIDALHRALDADFSPLTSCPSDRLPMGVRMIVNVVEAITERSMTWRINLIGIVNVLHVSTLVKSGKLLFDPEAGELVVTDQATAKDLLVVTNGLAAKPDRLRVVLLQAAMLTAAYRATGAERDLALTGSVCYYDEVAKAKPQNVSDFLDNLVALGLVTPAGKQSFKDSFLAGRASILAEAEFTQRSFDAMFVDPEGKPRDQKYFDKIGRDCIAQLIQPNDPDDFRRVPMLDDELWQKMTSQGPASLRTVLPEPLKQEVRLALVIHDYVVIRWWSNAMSTAAKKVIEMKKFLDGTNLTAEELKDNKDFIKRRRDLHNTLADVVKNSTPSFLDGWGVLAMYQAALRIANVRGILITAGPVISESRQSPLIASA